MCIRDSARGLAFTAVFTLVPALLLIASIAGLVVGDPETRARIAAFLAAQFPPLADLLNAALDTALAHAGAFSLIGAAILAWSASGLVRDLDGAFGILFREAGNGRTLLRTVGEVLVVAIAVVGLGLIVVLATVPGPVSELFGLAGLRLTAVLPLGAVFALAFRFLPRYRPGGLGGARCVRPDRRLRPRRPRALRLRGPLWRVRGSLRGPGLALVHHPAAPDRGRLGGGARGRAVGAGGGAAVDDGLTTRDAR